MRSDLVVQIWGIKRVLSTDKVIHENASRPTVKRMFVRLVVSSKIVDLRSDVIWCAKKQLAVLVTMHHL